MEEFNKLLEDNREMKCERGHCDFYWFFEERVSEKLSHLFRNLLCIHLAEEFVAGELFITEEVENPRGRRHFAMTVPFFRFRGVEV